MPIVGIVDGRDRFNPLGTTAIDGLDEGWHEYTVEVRDSTIVVSVGGKIVLGQEVKLGPSVRLAFTAANGEFPASQVVAKVSVQVAASSHR